MPSITPFLRCPPFPDAERAVDRFNGAIRSENFSDGDVDRLAGLLAKLRVGGEFWRRSAPADMAGSTVVLVGTMVGIDSVAHGGGPDAPVLIAMNEALTRRLQRRGITAHVSEFDPWSVLAGAKEFRCGTDRANADDDWVAVAALLGVPVNGEIIDPGKVVRERVLPVLHHSPYSGEPMEAEDAIRLLGEFRTLLDRNRDLASAAGIAWWKAAEMRSFLWQGEGRSVALPKRASTALDIASRCSRAVGVWPSKVPEGFVGKARNAGIEVYQIEDGFIRSIGLGAALTPPLSIVVDRSGMYYDPTQPSDLETILAHERIAPEMAQRGKALREAIVEAGLSKYAGPDFDAASPGQDYFPAEGRSGRAVLVTGQVEDDRSVMLGGAEVSGNLDLLRRVRDAEPEATVLFRPHPDVEAGYRRGAVPDSDALAYADRVVRGGAITQAIEAVDAVHVWTSLAGFEALLRGKDVVTHGMPFFAGWGLTRDMAPIPERRGRTLSLDELVAGTLILYPRYLDPVTRLPCSPEILVSRLQTGQYPPPTLTTRLRAIQGRMMKRFGR